MDTYRSSGCSAQCFHQLSTTLYLEHFNQHVTNPASGKNTNFQSLFKVSRQKLRLFWEGTHTGTLSCIYAPFISPLHFYALSEVRLLFRRKHLRFCCDAGPYFPGSAVERHEWQRSAAREALSTTASLISRWDTPFPSSQTKRTLNYAHPSLYLSVCFFDTVLKGGSKECSLSISCQAFSIKSLQLAASPLVPRP